jgi:hypothetical protein
MPQEVKSIRRGTIIMRLGRWTFATLAMLAAGTLAVSAASAAVTLDRDYRLGDQASEGAVNNADVGSGNPDGATYDSAGVAGMGQLPFLIPVNTPNYVAITGRPDGVGGRGIEFNAAESEYLRGPFLGSPPSSFSSDTQNGTLDYAGVFDRGFQFWVRPASTAAQALVVDTLDHGVRILANGNYAMTYAGFTMDSGVAAAPGVWRHIEMVSSPEAFGHARLYIDGVARAVRVSPAYPGSPNDLVVGSNTGGDQSSFTGGTAEFFSGVIDDLKMFVFGSSSGVPPVDYGTFSLDPDNDFAAFTLSGVPGDVNNVGGFTAADVTAFIAGWRFQNRVNGVLIGDINSHAKGDLNFDGITDVKDLAIIQNLLPAAGLPLIDPAVLSVPEPATIGLLLVAVAVGTHASRRSRR